MIEGDLSRRKESLWIVAIYLAFLMAHVALSSQRATHWTFPNSTDEIQHLSLAYHLKENPAFFLKYEDLGLLAAPEYKKWGGEGNYLVHPSLYYHLIGLLLPAGETERPAYLKVRLANVVLSSLALLAIFWAGGRYLGDPRQHLILAAVVALCPMIGGLGGQINNDNLALLGGALVFVGLAGLASRGASLPAAALMALGFALGCWAKLIAGVLLGAWILLVHVFVPMRRGREKKPGAVYWSILGVALIIGALPYAHNLFAYGSPLFDTTHFYVDENAPRMTGLVDYMGWFFYALAASWVTNQPADALQMATLVLVLVLSVAGAWKGMTGTLREEDTAIAILAAGAVGAVLLVLPIHLAYAYGMHLDTGILGGPVFRYYLPIWPGLAAGAAVGGAALASQSMQRILPASLILLLAYSAIFAPAL